MFSLKKFKAFYASEDKVSFYSVVSIIIMSLIVLLFWGINFKSLPSELPLFYSLPWGDLQLATQSQFLILISMIILILLINHIVTWHLHSSQILIKRIISLTSVVTSFLIMITALKIILIFV